MVLRSKEPLFKKLSRLKNIENRIFRLTNHGFYVITLCMEIRCNFNLLACESRKTALTDSRLKGRHGRKATRRVEPIKKNLPVPF